jgi:hypothetical protein
MYTTTPDTPELVHWHGQMIPSDVDGADLNRGTYTGQAGPVYIEPRDNPGAYDREVFLVARGRFAFRACPLHLDRALCGRQWGSLVRAEQSKLPSDWLSFGWL